MRKSACANIVVLIILALILLLSGCGEDIPDGGALLQFDEDILIDVSCCSYKYSIKVIDTTTSISRWYWVAITLKDGDNTILVKGDSIYQLSETPNYCHGWVQITVDYLDSLQNGTYEFHVFGCDQESEIGNMDEVDIKGMYPVSKQIYTWDWNELDCKENCCNSGRWYAQFQHVVDNVVSIKADISTRYGKLCGWKPDFQDPYELDTATSASLVYCSIGREDGNDLYWGQLGYCVFRGGNMPWLFESYYCEVMTDQSGPVRNFV
ncbi:MAG: hypothetical protein V3V99_04620 [candidate division Zixibacteria bacterium]